MKQHLLKYANVFYYSIDEAKKRVTVRLFGDLRLDSEYELSGRLLIIPLSGKGKALTILRKFLLVSLI